MKTEKIIDGETILAIIVRNDDWQDGLNFISSEKDYAQVGFWDYKKGQKLSAHIHLNSPRLAQKTQEVIFVKQGSLRADIYNLQEKFLQAVELRSGDTAIFLNGGHGYEILEDDTEVLEVKNGPYAGAEKDRKRINT